MVYKVKRNKVKSPLISDLSVALAMTRTTLGCRGTTLYKESDIGATINTSYTRIRSDSLPKSIHTYTIIKTNIKLSKIEVGNEYS